jgi:hypothetical protein
MFESWPSPRGQLPSAALGAHLARQIIEAGEDGRHANSQAAAGLQALVDELRAEVEQLRAERTLTLRDRLTAAAARLLS